MPDTIRPEDYAEPRCPLGGETYASAPEFIAVPQQRIVEKLDEEVDIESESAETEEDFKELKEFLGHTPIQVMCGALLGILIGFVFPIDL